MPSLIDAKILVRACLKKAGIKYFNDESHFEGFDIRFDIRGRSAGQAGYKSHFGLNRQYYLRFNVEAMRLDWDRFVNVCIPHEIAHIVCYMRPELGNKHNPGWRRICTDLGGTGERCHTMQLSPGRRTKKFMYVATCGTEIELSSVRHNKIRLGHTYSLRATGGQLNNGCEFKRVA